MEYSFLFVIIKIVSSYTTLQNDITIMGDNCYLKVGEM